jgi:hypothetical protein
MFDSQIPHFDLALCRLSCALLARFPEVVTQRPLDEELGMVPFKLLLAAAECELRLQCLGIRFLAANTPYHQNASISRSTDG